MIPPLMMISFANPVGNVYRIYCVKLCKKQQLFKIHPYHLLLPQVLTGRIDLSLIVTDGTDGCLKFWKDSRHTIFNTSCKTAIETMHSGLEITLLCCK